MFNNAVHDVFILPDTPKLIDMKITNDFLFDNNGRQVDFQATPNKGGKIDPQWLIMHYTAATQAKGSISWFLNKTAKASAHLLVDRDGTITQFAPFNIATWHAGESAWNGLSGLNKASIGIELVNGGRLKKSGSSWICIVDKKNIGDGDVVLATHKNELLESAWHAYTEYQIQVAVEIASLLVKTYGLKDVLGHEDISPIRKCDPGPAFPMSSFRSRVLGRKDDQVRYHQNTEPVNIRAGAGTAFNTLTTELLPKGTKVRVLKRQGNWSFVEVLETVQGINDLEGWIASKFLVE
jgi:N-acetylmuramoyl-L-alanine amidase